MSLRARILLLAVGTATLVIVLAGVPIALMLRSAAYDSAERDARSIAQGTADYLSTGTYDDAVLTEYLERLNARGSACVTVVMGDGDVLGAALPKGVRAPSKPRGDGDTDHDQGHAGLGTVTGPTTASVAAGRVVQVQATSTQGIATVFVLSPDSAVVGTVRWRALAVIGSGILLLGIATVAAEATARRLTRPLRRTAEAATALRSGDLLARAPVEGPREVADVAVELNALADRIDELLAHERERTADLSHRLRTPLTAVRLGVEALPAGAARTSLEEQITVLERALTRGIQDARRPQREGLHPRCDAVAVVADRVAFWTPLAQDQGRAVGARMPSGPVEVRAAAEDLAAVLDALIENVIAHTDEGIGLEVAVVEVGGEPAVEVWDEGPGIPPEALSRGRSDRGSTGLGLDIARSFAVATGGALTLVSSPAAPGRAARHGVRLVLREPFEEPSPGSARDLKKT
ncbi:HAMP domain-containing sensor histidine kinase [Nocardioides sp.]|uniref:sensor histidine kinase n=1 Tax=Nocardioides sp. TaxID=35761 RepID=UPI00262C4BDF|nr:HAMP domain-containing sensor histidine kinase [Nocardioides sp.]